MPKKKLYNTEDTLREKLMLTTHERLVDILIDLYDNNIKMQKQLDIIFAGLDDNPKKITSIIKKEVSSLKKSTKFIDYFGVKHLLDNLNELRLKIANDLYRTSANNAFDLMLDFLELNKKTIERVDDSNGYIGDVFIMACEDFGKIAQNITHINITELVNIIFKLYMKDDYSIYENIVPNFKCALGNEGLDLLQAKFEQIADKENIFIVKPALQKIADCKNDVNAFIHYCSFIEEPDDEDYIGIAKRLIEHWRPKEALEWLDHIEIKKNHFLQKDRRKLKIQALELDGKYEQAQTERLEWFAEVLSSTVYGDILKNAKQEFKETFKFESINKAFQFHEPHIAIQFLTEIQEFDEVAKFVRLRFNELDGGQYRTLRPIADLLQAIDPISATLLYRKMLHPILEATKSKYYNYAAKDLAICTVLNNKIADWQNIEEHTIFFNNLEIKHKRKVSFWDEYKSALIKQLSKKSKPSTKT